jgi:hypothetical protein
MESVLDVKDVGATDVDVVLVIVKATFIVDYLTSLGGFLRKVLSYSCVKSE